MSFVLDNLFQYIFQIQNDNEVSWYFQFIKENISKLLKPEKYLFTYIKHLEKCKFKKNEEKFLDFKEFAEKFTSETLSELLFKSFVSKENQSFSYYQAKLFGNYVIEKFDLSNFLCFLKDLQ